VFKTILVPLNGVDQDEAALAAALGLARRFAAHFDCVRVRLGPSGLVWEGELVDVASGLLGGDVMNLLRERARERSQRAYDTFHRFCEREKIPLRDSPARGATLSANWCEYAGGQTETLVSLARVHDLTVVARDLLKQTDPTADLAGAVLLGSGRPVLLIGAKPPRNFTRTVAIAWKPGPGAARAVAAALPLLAAAKEVVVMVAREGDESLRGCREAAESLATSLQWHGAKTRTAVLGPSRDGPAQAIAGAAQRYGATLLIMGGYGHARTRERVFGGFTQDVLGACPLPALLFH
jgi:nucleotide-binding universal stress UspA family protein